MNVNARGAFIGYKAAAKQMIKQGRGGRIIGVYITSVFSTYVNLYRTVFIGACSVAGKKGLLKFFT